MSPGIDRNFIEHLTWDEVAQRIRAGSTAILPIGAAAKQHGFHLPMNTDKVQAEWLAARIAADLDAIVWPTVTYGYYPAFVEYAGSSSLSSGTFEAVIEDIVASISGFGCRAIIVLNTGMSTIAPIDRALARVGAPNVMHLRVYDGARFRRAAEQVTEQSFGSHADELETSLMLALAHDLVTMPRAEAGPATGREVAGPLTPLDATAAGYSRSGSYGDPTLATRQKGAVLLAATVDDMMQQVSAFIAAAVVAEDVGKPDITKQRRASQ